MQTHEKKKKKHEQSIPDEPNAGALQARLVGQGHHHTHSVNRNGML
jgi:hypothetical protein